MTLETKIHELWGSIAAINDLLSVSRVFTDRAPEGTTKPYATIQRTMSTLAGRTDKATESDVQIRIQHWMDGDKFDEGQAIQNALENLANRDFALTNGRVIDMIQDGPGYWLRPGMPTDRTWQFVTTFTARINRARTQ